MDRNETYGLLTDKEGGYLLIGPNNATSRYQGWFVRHGGAMHRIIESLCVPNRTLEISTTLNKIVRRYPGVEEEIAITKDAICQRFGEATTFDVFLDIAKMNDNRSWGRQYSSHDKDGCLIVAFSKKDHEAEPSGGEFTCYLAITSDDMQVLQMGNFLAHQYGYDRARNSMPYERHAYHAVTIRAKEVAYGFGWDEDSAARNAKKALAKIEELMLPHDAIPSDDHLKGAIKHAYHAARHSLSSMLYPDGIYAGLPWFYQTWSRDAAISLPALQIGGAQKQAKEILMRLLSCIGEDGLMPSQIDPLGEYRVFDAVGWTFHAAHKMMDHNPKTFTPEEIGMIITRLESAIRGLKKNRIREDLLYTDAGQSWMDAAYQEDTREGARIEHQALLLAMLKFHRVLTGKKDGLEKEIAAKTRYCFYRNGYLYDGIEDPTIRPNAFLAYHCYPELLDHKEWEACFDRMMPHLWCSFGGLASIDKDNPLFCGLSTGQDPKSYHRGDSWYFVNNIAAMCLYSVDRKKYKEYIKMILHASTRDILSLGALGHHGEVSSAHTQDASGCLAQAWSAATYMELVSRLHLKSS